jgi:adenylate cyclase
LQALACITDALAACRGLEQLLGSGMDSLSQHLGLDTACLYLCEPSEQSLYALASRGYETSGIGASIAYGLGLVGVAAAQRMPVRVADMARELRYGGVVREQIERVAGQSERELPLPQLAGVTSVLAVPLVVDGELFGVLSSESTRRHAYGERDELLLQTAGQILAQAVARALDREKEDEQPDSSPPSETAPPSVPGTLKVKYYGADDSIFLDGEYLIKGLPGRILWMLLTLHEQERRTTFQNRELRLNPSLELPRYRDNLEARLLLLQRRLLEKGGPLRISREQRGRLSLHCEQRIELQRG